MNVPVAHHVPFSPKRMSQHRKPYSPASWLPQITLRSRCGSLPASEFLGARSPIRLQASSHSGVVTRSPWITIPGWPHCMPWGGSIDFASPLDDDPKCPNQSPRTPWAWYSPIPSMWTSRWSWNVGVSCHPTILSTRPTATSMPAPVTRC
ncbi:hypothetical protein BN2364_0642 [Alloalcanivorax xenomutans]|nr:hypothetical protein BN2364_0642 [Alloalcanivorax xenomutans]